MKLRLKQRTLSWLMALSILTSAIIIPVGAAEITPTGSSVVDTGSGYTYGAMLEDLDTLENTYGELVDSGMLTVSSIGQSELGRNIPVAILGNSNAAQKLYVQGAAQASDALSAAFVVKQLEYYLANWDNTYNGTPLREIFSGTAIAFVPMVNPDGVTLVTEGEAAALSVVSDTAEKEAYSAAISAARNLSVTNDPNGGTYAGTDYWNANINGVDLYYNFFNHAMLWRGSAGEDGATLVSAAGSLGNYLNYHNGRGAKLLNARAYGSYGTGAALSSAETIEACAQPESAAVKAFLENGGYTIALDYGNAFAKDITDNANMIYWNYNLDQYFPEEGGVIGDSRLSALAASLTALTGYTSAGAAGPKGFAAWFQIENNGKFAARINLSSNSSNAFNACKNASLHVLTYCMDTTSHPMGFEIQLPAMEEVESSILTGDMQSGRYTYLQMMSDIETLKTTYAGLMDTGMLTVSSIGASELGRNIPVIILGNRQAQHKLYVQGAAQATEYQNALILMKQIEYYCANMEHAFSGNSTLEEERLRNTLADSAIAFVPMANPDGVMLVLEGYASLNEAGLNLSADQKLAVQTNCNALLNGTSLTAWDSNINGIDVYYNVYTSQMASLAGIYTNARKAAAYSSGSSCNTAFGASGMLAAESEAISSFIAKEQFNLLLDYQLGGTTSSFSNGSTEANPKDLRWAVSNLQAFGVSAEDDTLYRSRFNTLSAALAAFTGYTNVTIKIDGVGGTSGLSARALDGWFQSTFPGSFGCVLDNASCTADTFSETWAKRKDASLFLLRYAADNGLVAPIDRSMDVSYTSVIDTGNQRYDYYDIKADLNELKTKYASLITAGKVTFSSVGSSELGREIPVVMIGNRSGTNKLYVMGNEHAREDINARLVMKQIELYLEMLQNYPDMRWQWNYNDFGVEIAGLTWGDVFADSCIALVPTANPDGLQLIYDGESSLYDEDCTAMSASEKAAVWANIEQLAAKKYASLKAEEGYIGGEIIDPDALNQQVFYTADGKPYNYTMWKCNIKGLDTFYNFYDWNQYNLGTGYTNADGTALTTLSSFLRYWKTHSDEASRIDYYARSSETSYGTFGMEAAEVKAIADFIIDEGFNMAMTYHNRGPVLKWDYRLGSYYPAGSGVDGAGWSQTIRNICDEIAKPSGYPISANGSPPSGFVAWFQTSHIGSFSVNVETGYSTFNDVFDAAPLRVAQFDNIWEENKYGPMITLTFCAYHQDALIPEVSAYENLSKNYWPDYSVYYTWNGDAPAGLAAPTDTKSYTYAQYLAGTHLATGYVPGYQVAGVKDGIIGVWTFNGWEFTGWLRGQAKMHYTGSWSFTASAPISVLSASIVDTSDSYTYGAMLEDLEALETTYASLVEFGDATFTSIGKSELGRDIPAVILGNPDAGQKLYVQGALQASDALSAAFVVKQLEYYLANFNNTYNGTVLREIFSDTAIAFVPMVNPDGVTLVSEGESAALSVVSSTTSRNTYTAAITAARNQSVSNDPYGSVYEGSDYWNANINGVDLYYNFFNHAMIWRGSSGTDGSSATSASGSLGNYLTYHNQRGAKLMSPRAYGSYGTSGIVSSSETTDACAQAESAAVKAFLQSGGYTIALDYGNAFAKDSTDNAGMIYWNYNLDQYFPNEGGVIGDARLSALASSLSTQTGYSLAGAMGPKGFAAWFQIENDGQFAARINLSDHADTAFTSCKDTSLHVLTYCMDTANHPMGFAS